MTPSATNNAIRQIIPHNVPLIFAKISPLELKRTRKYYRQLITNLGIRIPPIDPEELIRVKAGPLGMSENAVEKAMVYLETMRKSIRGGISPYTIAATAVYLTLKDEGAPQEKIAKTFGITPVSIRNLLKVLQF